MKVIVIIPAAGLGTRMAPMPGGTKGKQKKSPPSKQFTELGGTPILLHTLRKFAAVDAVTEIWIALRENEMDGFRARLQSEGNNVLNKKVELVVGGEHRQESVGNALNAITLYDFRVPVVLVDGRVVGEGSLDRTALARALAR